MIWYNFCHMRGSLSVKIEQFRRGLLYFISLKKRRVSNVGITATTKCNSRCNTCHIWKKKERTEISLKAIDNILKNDFPGTEYFLTGGEFILHPHCEEIIQKFKDKNYVLLSNGILGRKLLEIVKRNKVPRVALSFDGVGEMYKKVRGVDNFDNLHTLIHELNKICIVSLNFTINPLNNYKKEILLADKFAKEHGVYLALGIYDNPIFFETTLSKTMIPDLSKLRPYPLSKYLSLYNKWFKGQYRLPCFGIRNTCMVLPNGDVNICVGKDIVLGNLNRKSLKEIWEDAKTKQKQDELLQCNSCWLLCQKPMDIMTWDILKLLPRQLLPDKYKKFL